MKKKISPPVLALSAMLGSMPAIAQDAQPTPDANAGMQSTFGVKGGVNWSNLWIKEVNDNNARFGFHVGMFARFASEDAPGFQIEAIYDQKGETVKKSFGVIDQEITYKFDYATVPLLVTIPLGKVLELQGGGYLAYMVLSEVSSKGDLGEGFADPADGKFNGFDYGLVGGAAINLGLGQVGVRYEHGLNELANNQSARDVLGNAKTSTLQAYLAIALGK
jgi:hypothetical protein